ncbi:MAG TPA: hypothetical protein VFU05_01405 [Cyclobacteriaceae bacterium]|nr:hypothetical protein [Cyclobacteriaceae bacterium]
MILRGNHKANLNGSEKAPFQVRYITIAFLIAIFAHTAIQLSLTGGSTGLVEFLGIPQHDPVKAVYQHDHNSQQPGTTLPIAEFLKESEVEEKPPLYKVYNFYSGLDLIKGASIGIAVNLHRGFLRSLQNRPSLSLFILHHSWKSYIS